MQNTLRGIVGAAFRLRASLIPVVVLGFLLQTDQGLETLRAMASDTRSYSLLFDAPAWTIALTGAIIAHGLLTFLSSRNRAKPLFPVLHGGDPDPDKEAIDSRDLGCILLLAGAPQALVAWSLWGASRGVTVADTVHHMWFWGGFQAFIAFCLIVAGIAFLLMAERLEFANLKLWAWLGLAGALAFGALMWWLPNDGLRVAPAVLVLAMVLWVGALGALAALGDHLHFPILGTLGALFLLVAWMGWDDHHVIQARARFFEPSPPPVDSAFKTWLDVRQAPAMGEFPVVIVTSEGGGIRAAITTAMVLDKLGRDNLAFATRLFAIVGVSGGSVGATGYVAALSQQKTASPWKDSFYGDLLSPTLRSMLGLDLLARFVPYWLVDLSAWTRGRALEGAWTDAWRAATNTDIATKTFRDIYSLASLPNLVLMTTSATDGGRVAISPFTFKTDGKRCSRLPRPRPTLRTLADENRALDPYLATAAFMSARFPLISPAARLPGDGPPRRLVDGGYFENSGISTALDIIYGIQCEAAGRAKIMVVRIENSGAAGESAKDSRGSFLDFMLPMRTLYQTGDAHGRQAVAMLDDLQSLAATCRPPEKCLPVSQVVFRLREGTVPLPLGWTISGAARDEIARQIEGHATAFQDVTRFLTTQASGVPR